MGGSSLTRSELVESSLQEFFKSWLIAYFSFLWGGLGREFRKQTSEILWEKLAVFRAVLSFVAGGGRSQSWRIIEWMEELLAFF